MIKSCIYMILNQIDNKFYIGSTVNYSKRTFRHKYLLRNNKHTNKYLQSAYNKYGEAAFKFEIIEYVEKPNLIEREQYYLDKFKSYDRTIGYNLRIKAENSTGLKASKETLLKMSLANINKIVSNKTKIKISNALKGRKHTTDHSRKIALAITGRPVSQATRLKMSQIMKNKKTRLPLPMGQ